MSFVNTFNVRFRRYRPFYRRTAIFGKQPVGGGEKCIGFDRALQDAAIFQFHGNGPDADIRGVAANHFLGLGQRCAAAPALDDIGITGLGERALAPVRAD